MNPSNTEKSANILIVDDDLHNLRLLAEVLSRLNYNVRPIRDGRLVLGAVQAEPPDLILLDIMMPHPDGYEVCTQLKADEIGRHIPIIFLSALHESFDKVKAFSLGGADYITKPFQIEEAIARIENQLKIFRLQKQLAEKNRGLQREIQERQLMEEKLRASQAEIQGFFEAMADIVLIVDAKGKILKVAPTNPEKLYPPGTNILDRTIQLFYSDVGDRFRDRIKLALETQQVVNCEYSLKVGEGTAWFSASIAPTSNNTVAWVARDISDRVEAEAKLKKSEMNLTAAQRVSHVGNWQWDIQTGAITGSEETFRILGRDPSNFTPTYPHILRFIHPDDRSLFKKSIEFAINLKTSYKFDLRILQADRSIRNLEVVVETILDENAQVKQLFGTFLDITVRKQAEDELRLLFLTTQALSNSLNIEQALGSILYLITRVIDWHCAEAWLPSEKGDRLVVSCGWYGYKSCLEEFRQSSESLCLGTNSGVIGRVWTSGRAEWIDDIDRVEQSTFLRKDIAQRVGLKAGFFVPVVADGKVLVILGFYKQSSCSQNKRLIDLVKAVSAQLSSLIRRKQAEAALRTSEERLHFALEGSSLALWDWNLKTDHIYHDRAWKEMLGYQDSDLGDTLEDFNRLLHPEDLPIVTAALKAYLQGEQSFYEVECRMLSKRGGWKWIFCRGKISEWDEQGQPVRLTGTYRDISDRKIAELALQQSQRRYQTLAETSPVCIFHTDVMGNCLYVNQRWGEIAGRDLEHAIGSGWTTSLHPEDRDRIFQEWNEAVAKQIPFKSEYRFVSADGHIKWVIGQAIAEVDSHGEVIGYIGTVTDITDRKRTEEELQATTERLELVLQASQDGFWDWNLVTGEIFFSPRFKEMLGYEDSEFPNQLSAWKNVIFEEDLIAALKLVEDYNADRVPQFLATQRFHHKNGSTVYILSRAIHLKDTQGTPIRMIGAHTDITNLKQAEEALQQAVLAADAANRAKSEFLASMSHELRTPLNAILGFSQIMNRDQSLSIEHQKNLLIINRAGEHLLGLIDDILEVSKIEAGRTTFNETSFDLLQLLESLEKMLQLKANSKGLQLIFETTHNLPQYVKTDEGKLRQVLLNLLGNAIKFTQVGRVALRVSVKEPFFGVENTQQTLHFEIEDTGPGIAPEEIHVLFEAFAQTETGRKSQQGTGLGLPISQKYVQLMGGEISVSSILGKGSLFSFDIQIVLADADLIEIWKNSYGRVSSLAPNQPEYRILIVDDVLESRLLLQQILTSMGFSVREAENGQEAIELWENWQPHLILMDMRMPILDGYEATRTIRIKEQEKKYLSAREEVFQEANSSTLDGSKTKIFALTASAFEEQRKMILSIGCDDFIRKPFQVEVLLEKIHQYLGVQYEWEGKDEEVEIERETPVHLTDIELQQALSEMPHEWLTEIYEAAFECSDDMIIEKLNCMSPDKAALANTLKDLAENFQFVKIMELTQGNIISP